MTRASYMNFYPVMSDDADMTQTQACKELYELITQDTGLDCEPDVLDGEITIARGNNYPYEPIREAIAGGDLSNELNKYYVLVCIPRHPKAIVYERPDPSSTSAFEDVEYESYTDRSPQSVIKDAMEDEGYNVQALPTVPPSMKATPEL